MKNQTVKNQTCFKTRGPKVQKWIFIYTWIDYFKSDFDSSNFHAFFFFFFLAKWSCIFDEKRKTIVYIICPIEI